MAPNAISRFFVAALLAGCFPGAISMPKTSIKINDGDDIFDLDAVNQPYRLEAVDVTQNSIQLRWNLSSDVDPDEVEGYRIFYQHQNFQDVKTVKQAELSYVLTDLEPYTEYEIWIQFVANGTFSEDSEHIFAVTDVEEPGKPEIVNATCHSTGSLYIKWTKPLSYDRSVDNYKIYYKASSSNLYEDVTVDASDPDEQDYILSGLDGNRDYVVRICAVTKSVSNPDNYLLGNPSDEVRVYLPERDCKIDTFVAMGADFKAELSIGMIVGAVGSLLFLVLAIIGFVVWRQYFKAAYYYLDEPSRIVPPPGSIPNWEDDVGPEGDPGKIPVDDFSDYVAKMHADTDALFAKEYGELQKFCVKSVKATHDHSSHPDNKCKNRYLNIVAYDHSRVRLLPILGQKKTSDYINANYIDGFQKANAYIGTQGPLDDTCEAFWRMVWEQNVYVIVMITNLMERGRRKCDKYWPKDVDESETYGHIEITLTKEEVMANYTVRSMKIKHLKLKRKKGVALEREIKQFHYTSWPDHGVPCHALPVLTFIRKSVASNPEADGGPIIVHCSAGVGRTGTYIAIDALQRQAAANNEFNVYGFLRHIRGQRNHLVQTEEQYVFIHDALLEAQKSGITEISRENLSEYVESLNDVAPNDDADKAATKLDAQFKMVTSFEPSEYHYASARMDCNLEKIRNADLVPVESSRIPLAPKPGVEGSDFVNASWLHGHAKLREFIVTQHPISEHKDDFWRMLWDHNAQTVVLLSPRNDEYPVFWPAREADFELETFRVRYVEEAVHEGHSTLDFVVSSQHDDYELAVRIIHCPDWSHSLEKIGQAFDVLKLVHDWHLEYQDGPLVVVDKNGGTEAATFCALTTLCKQLETYNSVDVYQVAKLYHNKRPGIWRNADDLMFLYKAMEALVAANHGKPLQNLFSTEKITAVDGVIPATATTSVTDAAAISTGSSSEKSSIPDRLHSANDRSECDHVVVVTEINNATSGSGEARRHSLTNGNGCAVALKSTPAKNEDNDEDEDEDDEISETAALTAV